MFIIVHKFTFFMYSNLSVCAFMASVSHGMLTVFKLYWSFQQSPSTRETLTDAGLFPGRLAAFSMVGSLVSASSCLLWISCLLTLVPKPRRLAARDRVLWTMMGISMEPWLPLLALTPVELGPQFWPRLQKLRPGCGPVWLARVVGGTSSSLW